MPPLNQIDFAHFIESTKGGKVWKVMIIEEGLSKNAKYYPEGPLRDAIPLFENSKVCYYEWAGKHYDHLPMSIERIRPEGFPLQTAGCLKNVKYETISVEGRKATGLTGMLHFFETNKVKALKEMLVNAWKKGLKNILGLSINAEGQSIQKMLNNVPVQVVECISNVFSTDLVTQPAAGGSLLNLIESINKHEGGSIMNLKMFLEALMKLKPKILEGINIASATAEEVVGILATAAKESTDLEPVLALAKESKFDEGVKHINTLLKASDEAAAKKEEDDAAAAKKITDDEAAAAAAANKDPDKKEGEPTEAEKALEARQVALGKKLDDQNEKVDKAACKESLKTMLGASKLPAPVKEKIANQFKDKIFKESELKESNDLERKTLAKLVESSTIMDLGDVGQYEFSQREPVDRLQASMDLMVDYKPEDAEKEMYDGVDSFSSLREAYIAYTDDPGITGQMGPAAVARMQEATTSTFNYALGYTINRKMLPEYRAIKPLWEKIAAVTSIANFKMQERIKWGGFGIIPTVQAARTSQGTPVDSATPTYPELGFPADTEETYGVETKGGIVTLTRRMIINDDLKILKAIPKKIGAAAGHTLNEFVFDLMLGMASGVINAATLQDSVALYNAAHNNYSTSALGYDNFHTLLNNMYYQYETGYTSLVDDSTFAAADTTLDITAGTGQYFKAGDFIAILGEILRVVSVSTDALTVVRGQFGTTDAEHADGETIYKITRFLAIEKPLLWVPRTLNSLALQLVGSDKNPEAAENGINTLKGQFSVNQSPYLKGDENNYFLSAPVSDIESIEVGFLNGRKEPEIFVQDQPTVGNVFTYDTIRYKVRHEYGGAVIDHRGLAAGIVA